MNIYLKIFNRILQLLYNKVITEYKRGLLNIYNNLWKAAFGHYVMNATDIGHSDASQNYEKMGTEFILPLLFYENIDILLCKNSQGSFN